MASIGAICRSYTYKVIDTIDSFKSSVFSPTPSGFTRLENQSVEPRLSTRSPENMTLDENGRYEHIDTDNFSSRDDYQRDLDELHFDKLEKATVRKMDLTILPILTMFSLLNLLDRTNLGNVRVIGLQTDLDVSDVQITIALTFAFIPYILIELPSNMIMHKLGAGVLLPALIVGFGFVTMMGALMTNFRGLVVSRFFLGLLEGGLYPGTVLYLSSFYTRNELQLRLAMIQSASCLSGAFSGVLTYLINQMDGTWGLAGWSWVFFIEGVFTMGFGILGFFLLPSTPQKSRFLTAAQKKCVYERLKHGTIELTTDENTPKFSAYQVWEAIRSPHVIMVCLAGFFGTANANAIAYFQPLVIHSLGFDPSITQLASAAPYVSTFLIMITTSYISDKHSARGATTVLSAFVALVGYTVFYCIDGPGERYGTLFISMAGVYSCIPPLVTWMSNNSEPYFRRAVAVALFAIFANLGGVMSVWLFAYADKPRYDMPTLVNIACSLAVMVLGSINQIWLKRQNNQKIYNRAEILSDYGHGPHGDANKSNQVAWEKLGDRHPDFRYVS